MLPSASELCQVSRAAQEDQRSKGEERLQDLMERALSKLENEIVASAKEGRAWYRWDAPNAELVTRLASCNKTYSKSGYCFWMSRHWNDKPFIDIIWDR